MLDPQKAIAGASDTSQKIDAERAMWLLHAKLEAILNRHQPGDYARFAATQLAAATADPKMLAQIRPHHILHSIEANCSFTRRHNRDAVTWDCIARVMNVYHEHQDPLKAAVANLTHLFLLMHREQIEIQHSHTHVEIARHRQIFVDGDPMPRLAREYETRQGLSFDQWLTLSFMAAAAAHSRPTCDFHRDSLAKCEFHDIPSDRVDAYLKAASRTPRQIGDEFWELRKRTKPQFHSLIRSIFLKFPLMALDDAVYLAPNWELVLRHSGQGLYKAIKALPSFGKEFGRSVQRYIGKLLSSAVGKARILTDSDLEKHSPGKSCDFLLEFADCVLLLESKATSFVAEHLTENAILNDGSTGKIAEGIEQLYTTAHDLHSGVFNAFDIDRSKPAIGIVATFGDIPFANSDWYFKTFILARAGSKLQQPIFPSMAMSRAPIVMTLGTLESLIAVLNFLPTSIVGLCGEKDSLSYMSVGDWDTFLRDKVTANELDLPLPFVTDSCNRFFAAMGILPSATPEGASP
jgi:hypothetical protein